MNGPAFRRRILIEPSAGCVVAELEDDWHRMVVTLRHEDGVATLVQGEMKRWPWTTCQGAIERLADRFTGLPLASFARQGDKTSHCTHLFDLAIFAAAHAQEAQAIAYDITVSDPVDSRSEASLLRNGQEAMAWSLREGVLIAPEELAGTSLYKLGDWIASLDTRRQEAARILRWASILAFGRAMDIPEGLSATAFGGGTCYTFQPEQAELATRRADVPRDFSLSGILPLADRSNNFKTMQESTS